MITAEQVAAYLSLPTVDATNDAALLSVVAAVNSKVAQWHGYTPDSEWTDAHKLGALMLAAHLYRRRNTPGGVESFNELGPVYVQRSDPHVSMLLGLGGWTPPVVA